MGWRYGGRRGVVDALDRDLAVAEGAAQSLEHGWTGYCSNIPAFACATSENDRKLRAAIAIDHAILCVCTCCLDGAGPG